MSAKLTLKNIAAKACICLYYQMHRLPPIALCIRGGFSVPFGRRFSDKLAYSTMPGFGCLSNKILEPGPVSRKTCTFRVGFRKVRAFAIVICRVVVLFRV